MTEEQLNRACKARGGIERAGRELKALEELANRKEYISIKNLYDSVDLSDYLEESDFEEIFALIRYRIMNKRRAFQAELDNL